MAMRDLIPWGRQQQSTVPSMMGERDWSPISSFRREVDRLFDDMFRSPVFSGFGSGTVNWPSIEVTDTDREVLVTAEVPGMTEKDVELLLDNGVLTIRGEKKGQRDESGYSERWYGRFERQIPLPVSVEEDKCKADFHDGVLTVHLPKSAEAEDRKRIPINAATQH